MTKKRRTVQSFFLCAPKLSVNSKNAEGLECKAVGEAEGLSESQAGGQVEGQDECQAEPVRAISLAIRLSPQCQRYELTLFEQFVIIWNRTF